MDEGHKQALLNQARLLSQLGLDDDTVFDIVTGAAPIPPQVLKQLQASNQQVQQNIPGSSMLGAGMNEGFRGASGLLEGGLDFLKGVGNAGLTALTQDPRTTASQFGSAFKGGVEHSADELYNAYDKGGGGMGGALNLAGHLAMLPADALTGGGATRVADDANDAIATGDYRKAGQAIPELLTLGATANPEAAMSRVASAPRAALGAVRAPFQAARSVGNAVGEMGGPLANAYRGLKGVATSPLDPAALWDKFQQFRSMRGPAAPTGPVPGQLALPPGGAPMGNFEVSPGGAAAPTFGMTPQQSLIQRLLTAAGRIQQ